jgi:FMN phosphatase YigB (HAD superfamily)
VRAICLDMIGVLVLEKRLVSKVLFEQRRDWRVTREELKQLYDEELSLGRTSEAKFWNRALRSDWDDVRNRFLCAVRIDGDARGVIATLSRRFRIAVASDMCGDWGRAILRHHRLDELVDVQLYSSDIGESKSEPDGLFFEVLEKRLEVSKANVLLVDDQDTNVSAALAVGLQARLYAPSPSAAGDTSISALSQLPSLFGG